MRMRTVVGALLAAAVGVAVVLTAVPALRARGEAAGRAVRRRYGVVLVAMFRNEAPYLLEWVSHHVALGVEHVYLYDHASDDDFMDVLAPLVARGLVTVTPVRDIFHGKKEAVDKVLKMKLVVQLSTLNHFYNEFAKECVWAATIDIDEFVAVEQGVEGSLRGVLMANRFRDVGAVNMARIPFSTSGKVRKMTRDELATAEFTERKKEEFLGKEAGKIFYYVPRLVAPFLHLHDFRSSSAPLANAAGEVNLTRTDSAKDALAPYENTTVPRVYQPLSLLHYLARSYESCKEKQELSRQYGGGWRHRMAEDDCDKRHSSSPKFAKRLFGPDERLKRQLAATRPTLCATMRGLNPGYCKKVSCCGRYQVAGVR